MQTSRRGVLLSGAALLFLGACTTPVTPSQVASDVALIAQAFAAELPNLSNLVPAAAQTAVTAAITDMQAVVSAFAAADTQNAQQPLVQRIGADINAVFATLPKVSLPTSIQALVNDINALLPIIELAVGLITVGKMKALALPWAGRVTQVLDAPTARVSLRVLAAGK
jgi:hypothetical protein